MKRLPAIVAASAFALTLAERASAAESVGVTWADCVVSPKNDADRDGLDDDCEYAVVKAFEPELVFGPAETMSARIAFFSARSEGPERLRVFYALGYLEDLGDPTLGGVSAHDGDSEFVVLRLRYDGGGAWSLTDGYLSAHYGTFCDAGGWFPAEEFESVGEEGGRPRVYVAEGKHANYTDLARCDAGGCYQDHCGDTKRGVVGVLPTRDLGVRSTPLLDDYTYAGATEWFWTDVPFCGWQRAPGESRSGCAPAANSYAVELAAFDMDQAPVAPVAALCEPCASDGECADGGVCIAGECGRACEAFDCPSGTRCEGVGFGIWQCLPEATCGAYRACLGRACGDDGFGGSCGTCADGESCTADGQCVVESPADAATAESDVRGPTASGGVSLGCATVRDASGDGASRRGLVLVLAALALASARRRRD